MSTSTPTSTPDRRADAAIPSMPATESAATVTDWSRASAATRSHAEGPTISLAMRMSAVSDAATSASDTVAHVSPVTDPAARSRRRRAISGVLCALKCGRSRQGPSAKNRAIRWMLLFIAATSTMRAGVGISVTTRGGITVPSCPRCPRTSRVLTREYVNRPTETPASPPVPRCRGVPVWR